MTAMDVIPLIAGALLVLVTQLRSRSQTPERRHK